MLEGTRREEGWLAGQAGIGLAARRGEGGKGGDLRMSPPIAGVYGGIVIDFFLAFTHAPLVASHVRYAKWEEKQRDFTRARNIMERGLDVDYRQHHYWLRYAGPFGFFLFFLTEYRHVRSAGLNSFGSISSLF